MTASEGGRDRQREATRRDATERSVFLSALAGTAEDTPRAVVRHDVHLRALDAARRVLRTYQAERRHP
jgi:hypothetical protein